MVAPRRGIAVPVAPADGKGEPPACTPSRFYAYWIFALAAAVSAFASHIYVRQRIVDLGYQLGQERAHRAALENERRDLELELASLEAPADLAQLSRDVLGLDVPRDDQMIEIASAGAPGARPTDPARIVVPSEPFDPATTVSPPAADPANPVAIGPVAPAQPAVPVVSGPDPADPSVSARHHRRRRAPSEPAPMLDPAPTPMPTPEAAGQQPTAIGQQPSPEAAP